MRPLHLRKLGLVEYADGLALQKLQAAARAAGTAPDTLFLLEHPKTITLGRGAKAGNVVWPAKELEARGYSVHETDRGGDVTYHGPGQLVGYPIFDLKPDRKDVRKFMHAVEEVMIRTARGWGIEAERVQGRVGVWVKRDERGMEIWEKLGATGVHFSRWISTHGFALNVRTQLDDFRAIVPCGISDAWVCSLESLLAREGKPVPTLDEVARRAGEMAGEVWESEISEVPIELNTISLTVIREGLHGDELLLLRRVPERGGFWQTLTGRIEAGEAPHAAAARELFEETGFAPSLDLLQPLGYTHSFALDPALAGVNPALPARPIFCRETAFAIRVEPSAEPRLEPREHDAFRWAPLEDALALLPFAGLRRGVRMAIAKLGAPQP